MGNLLQVLFASIRAKITPIVTKFRLWTNKNFIQTRVIAKVREFFVSIFDVKPRHKKDYYPMVGWLVSKRLAFAVVLVVGCLSLFYIVKTRTSLLTFGQTEGVRTYSYNSVPLRFAKGNVRIQGKSKYLAYEGNVSKGAVEGYGRLYNPEGTLIYAGNFANSKYEGSGTEYYESGVIHYQGYFSNNLYEEEGKLYHENGSSAYAGAFSKGLKEGEGVLFDDGGNTVYEGTFSSDEIVYSSFLGQTTEDVSKVYKGKRELYEGDGEFVVIMDDIDAAYVGRSNSEALADEVTVDSIYVIKDYFAAGENHLTTISQLTNHFGRPEYEGNSDVTMPEAVIINYDNQKYGFGSGGIQPVSVDADALYDDYFAVNDFDRDRSVYLYSYRSEGLIYTFVCPDRDGRFVFYFILKD